ncbi:MAG: hypothetical protein BGN87_18615 [Rhizobiales bacterium 65-79]|nr:hypothetical protein [Hyphomicrobiales bacterium]OJU03614.1 MAG: hypothetical protein BGN87_18615 [Rhizobiales bacterium 65-79]
MALDILLAKDSRFDGIRKGKRHRLAVQSSEEMTCQPLVHAASCVVVLHRLNMTAPFLPALHGQPLQ